MYFDVNLLTALFKKILRTVLFYNSPVKVQLSRPISRAILANYQNINMFAVHHLTVKKFN